MRHAWNTRQKENPHTNHVRTTKHQDYNNKVWHHGEEGTRLVCIGALNAAKDRFVRGLDKKKEKKNTEKLEGAQIKIPSASVNTLPIEKNYLVTVTPSWT